MNKQADAIQSIDDFLTSVNAQSEKQGEAHTEAGGYAGGTTHPVKDVDDRTETADTGFRHAENASDNKAEPNRGDATVDNTAEASTSTQSGNFDQDSVQYNIGTQQAATGEEPSVETGSAKSTKEDDGYTGPSSHPARTDNDALDGHKYANVETMSLEELAAGIQKAGNAIVAGITANSIPKQGAEGGGHSKDPKSQPHADVPPGKGKKKEAEAEEGNKEAMDVTTAANAGAELASLLNSDGSINNSFDKQSADYMVQEFLYDTIKQANDDADNVIRFAYEHQAAKEAMGPEEMMSGGEEPLEAAMHEEPGEAGGPEGGEEEMLAALAGGGEGGEGAPMMGAEQEMGGGGEEEELALLQQILGELEGEEPGAAKEVAAALKQAAATNKQGGDKKAEMKAMLKELIGRSKPAA